MKRAFQYAGREIPYMLTRTNRRKTIRISVDDSGQVHIAAPAGLSEQEIIQRVKTRGAWILRKLAEVQAREYSPAGKKYVEGESFLVLGEDCKLRLHIQPDIKRISIRLNQGNLLVATPTEEQEPLKLALESWYRSKAREVVEERINCYYPQVGASPVRVRIKDQKRRWGSCSSKGNLNFNWRVVMAPLPVLDYVIVHELCHLIHLNHSKEFWSLVESVLPDYKERREWLKKNGASMTL